MKVLVTGAGGFVGGYLVSNLLDAGHQVVGAAHREFRAPEGVATEVFDVRQAEVVKEVVRRHSPEGVVHLAAQASVPRSWEDPGLTYRVNLIGAHNLLNSLEDETRVVLVGSAQVYGRAKLDRPLKESDPPEPSSPYAISKAAQEMLGQLYHRELDRPMIMTRPFNHTGPGQSSEYAVAAFCERLVRLERQGGGEMKVGRLDSVRDFLDVRDVVEAYRLLLESGQPGEIYNVASGEGAVIGDILKILLEASGIAAKVKVVSEGDRRAGDPDSLIGDNSKIRAAVGWSPRIPLRQSLVETLEWHRNKQGEDE